jgi:DNA-binding transcriptional regulator LsrR (DeoR family)
MRSAVLQLPSFRSAGERRQVLRSAIRQIERADIYLVAVGAMGLDDRAANRELLRLRHDLDALRRHLVELRAET